MGFMSARIWVVVAVTLLITPLLTTHEPPSKFPSNCNSSKLRLPFFPLFSFHTETPISKRDKKVPPIWVVFYIRVPC